MSWCKEGNTVAGMYMGTKLVIGKVTLSRVKYGGSVQHTVELFSPVEIFGTMRSSVLLDDANLIEEVSA